MMVAEEVAPKLKPLEVKAIDVPADQRACIVCRFFTEFGNCREGLRVDSGNILLENNKCPKFKPVVESEF